jgi:galactokinase
MTTSPQTAVPAAFQQRFGATPQVVVRAPGRVNLIGEHTDYNEGFVLPAALDRAVYLAVSPRTDDQVIVQSLDYHAEDAFSIQDLTREGLHEATLYPRGALHLLSKHTNQPIPHGFNLTLGSDVPIGAGLSSSAAVGVGMIEVGCALYQISLAQKEKALLAQRVENEFIGAPTGIMDQMISACGQPDHALLIDCRTLDIRLVPIPKGVSLLVLDTSTRHDHSTGGYGERRRECQTAATLLGVKSLRDVTPQELAKHSDRLPEVIERRAAHVVNENVRTLRAVEALNTGDLETVGRLIKESHASLSGLFQVSNKELDLMAEIAAREPGCYGARMMGGGFGGAVIALVADEAVDRFVGRVEMAYTAASHLKAYVYVAHAGAGSGILS